MPMESVMFEQKCHDEGDGTNETQYTVSNLSITFPHILAVQDSAVDVFMLAHKLIMSTIQTTRIHSLAIIH